MLGRGILPLGCSAAPAGCRSVGCGEIGQIDIRRCRHDRSFRFDGRVFEKRRGDQGASSAVFDRGLGCVRAPPPRHSMRQSARLAAPASAVDQDAAVIAFLVRRSRRSALPAPRRPRARRAAVMRGSPIAWCMASRKAASTSAGGQVGERGAGRASRRPRKRQRRPPRSRTGSMFGAGARQGGAQRAARFARACG